MTLHTDKDGVEDSKDLHDDRDGIFDSLDAFSTNPGYPKDPDSDGLPDKFEALYGLNPDDPGDASSDSEIVFGVPESEGSALIQLVGIDSSELMTKFTSPCGLIRSTECARENQPIITADTMNPAWAMLVL